MFFDKVKIYVKAGDGGNGSVSFHREKYIRTVVRTAATAARAATSSSSSTRGRTRC